MSRTRLAAAAALFLSLPAWSAPVAMSVVRATDTNFTSVVVDSVTGTAYERRGYENSTQLIRFANAAAMEAGSSNGTVALSESMYGMSMAAHSGTVYGRTTSSVDSSGWPNGTAEFSAFVGGTAGSPVTVAGMGTANGSETYDWGGFSGVNVMNDGQRLYVVGGDASTGNWRIATYDFDLNLLANVSFALALTGTCGTSPGFAFAIGGQVLFGDGYCSGQISHSVDALTGTVGTVSHTLTGFTGGSVYLANLSYDALGDTLYATDQASHKLYKLGNAAAAFGIDISQDVPEPSGLALVGLALALAGIQRRRARG